MEIPQQNDLCPICFFNPEGLLLEPCGHRFCSDCLSKYLDLKINEGDVLDISCPHISCTEKLNNSQIENLVSSDLYEKYKEFLYNKSLENDKNFKWCPIVNCRGYDYYTNSNKLICNSCSHAFCFLCSEPWHENKCIVRIYKNQAGSSSFKKCPKCRIITEKIGGCSSVVCVRCKVNWCWRCSKVMENHNQYECLLGKSRISLRWEFILGMLLFPIWFPFSPAILFYYAGLHFEFSFLENNRKIFYTLCAFFSPVIVGLFLACMVPALWYLFFYRKMKTCMQKSKWLKVVLYIVCVCLSIVTDICTMCLILLLNAAFPLIGLIFLVLKMFSIVFLNDHN